MVIGPWMTSVGTVEGVLSWPALPSVSRECFGKGNWRSRGWDRNGKMIIPTAF